MIASEISQQPLAFEEPTGLAGQEIADLETPEAQASQVVYSRQDFDAIGLLRGLQHEDILMPTFGHENARIESAEFQRSFVWNRPQKSIFCRTGKARQRL